MTDKGPKGTKLWSHITSVYENMAREAEDGEINGKPVKVWKGFATMLLPQLGVSQGYYGKVLKYLSVMGCVANHKRGAGTIPSEWLVLSPPTEQAFMLAKPSVEKGRPRDLAAIEQQLEDIRSALPKVDIEQALYDMQKQLDKQAKEIRALKKAVKTS